MIQESLPPIGLAVEAVVRFTRNWPECLGGIKITDKIIMVKRIKSKDSSKGWQWSVVESNGFINGNVISWHYR